jgi:hypothetical protein
VEVSQPAADQLHLRYTVRGEIGALFIPPHMMPARTDDLWKTTCFEVFIRDPEGAGYAEFNLSPSGQWAAYAFDGYRGGMRALDVPAPPEISVQRADDAFVLAADLALPCSGAGRSHGDADAAGLRPSPEHNGRRYTIALSAVIEETSGTKSYWALAHPPGAPDFHHADCFALTLPAFGAA